MKINSGYKISISQYPGDSNTANNTLNSNDFCKQIKKQITKEKKVKILDVPVINTSALLSKKSFKKSILKSKKSFNKNHNLLRLETNEKAEKSNKSNKSIFKLNKNIYPKSSLNINNQIYDKSFSHDKNNNSPNKSFFGLNNGSFTEKSFRSKGRKNKSRNNFLDIITHNNSNQAYNDSKSILGGNDFVEIFEGDSLNLIQKNLQNKIIDMGKEADFLELEMTPLELSINRLNLNQSKIKLTSRHNKKDCKSESLERHKTFAHHNSLNSNLNTSSSEDFLLENNYNNSKNLMNITNKKLLPSSRYSNKINSINKSNKYINNNLLNRPNNYYKINLMKSSANGRRYSINHSLKSEHTFTTIINRSKSVSGTKRSSIINENSKNYDDNEDLNDNLPIKKRNEIVVSKEKFRALLQKKIVYDSLDDEEIIEDVIEDNFYFYPNDNIVLIMDALILFFIFWNLIYKPLSIVLNNCDVRNTITSLSFDNIMNIFIDFLFFFDLIINFFKAFYNFDEQLVTKSEKIVLHYVKEYFVIDFISAIPYYSIIKMISYNNHKNLKIPVNCSKYYDHEIKDSYQIIELIKLIKLIKCLSNDNIITKYIINYLNQIPFFENWAFLMSNIFLSLLILHLTACMHIFISCTTFPNWIVQKNLHTSPFIKIYLNSIYFLITTITTVGYGDIIGNSLTEICFQIFLLIVGIVAYSWLISSLSNYVKENNKQKEIFNQKVSILKEIKLEHRIMTKELYDKIYLHLEYANLRQKKDKSSLIDSLPHSVKKELLHEMYKPIIENFNFFKDFKNSEFVIGVISKLKPVLAVKNDLLLDQGEIIEDTIFVKQGRLGLEVRIDTDHPEKSIEKLLNQEYFFGIENKEMYQKSGFGGILALTSNNKNRNFINKKNLYNLYSSLENNSNQTQAVKSVITDTKGEAKIQKHSNSNINYIHLRILDIRKNENFGALLMFLNKRSPLTLRVKTKKAELFFLKKIDAVEISTSYPNIWKRVNKKAFHNLKQIKRIMKNIIRHYCETYGINCAFGTTMLQYRFQNKDDSKRMKSKGKKPNIKIKSGFNSFNTFNNRLFALRRNSFEKSNSHLRIFQQIPEQTIISSKTKTEKDIEDLIPKNFDRSNIKKSNENISINSTKNSRKTNNNNNKSEITIESDNGNKKSKKETELSYDNHLYTSSYNDNIEMNNNQNNSESVNSNSNDLSKINVSKSINKNSNEKFKYTLKKNASNYGEEEANNLMKYFGTPYYPDDINDEVYPGEKFEIISQKIYTNSNNNNFYEHEFSQKNNSLLSIDRAKNNISKLDNNLNIQSSINAFEMNKSSNNFTINNNYITNNVINNVTTHKNIENLSICRFSIHFGNEKAKKTNLTVFKTSFLISSKTITNKRSINSIKSNNNIKKKSNKSNDKKVKFLEVNRKELEIDKTSKSPVKELKNEKINKEKNGNNNINIRRKRNNSCSYYVPINEKLREEGFSNDWDYTFKSYDSNSCNNSNLKSDINDNDNNKEKGRDIISQEKQTRKKSAHSVRFIKANSKQNKISSKFIVTQNIIIKINAKYENLNILTKGKICENKKLQNFIKDILIKKLPKNEEEEVIINAKSRKSTISRLQKNKTLAKYIPKKFLNNKVEINDKLKKTEVKSLFKKKIICDFNDNKNSIIPKKNIINKFKESKISSGSAPKRGKTKKKNENDEFLLHYVNRNIRDDNAVLNNPGKFYNGFFNDIMKKVSIKKIPKQK